MVDGILIQITLPPNVEQLRWDYSRFIPLYPALDSISNFFLQHELK